MIDHHRGAAVRQWILPDLPAARGWVGPPPDHRQILHAEGTEHSRGRYQPGHCREREADGGPAAPRTGSRQDAPRTGDLAPPLASTGKSGGPQAGAERGEEML